MRNLNFIKIFVFEINMLTLSRQWFNVLFQLSRYTFRGFHLNHAGDVTIYVG